MIGFFPTLLPDELLYSAYARYRSALGVAGHDRAHAALFGGGRGSAAVELPRSLEVLVARLPGDAAYTVVRLMAEHTTLPYYRPFKRPDHVARVERRMASAAPGTTHRLLLGGTHVATPADMNFCPACVAADRRDHGVAYWHRAHQLPGVLYCHGHAARLRASGLGRADRGAERGYHALEEVLAAHPGAVPDAAAPEAWRTHDEAALLGLARDTAWLLAADRAGPGLDEVRRRYHAALDRVGLTRGVYVRVPALRDHVAACYGAGFLASLGCALDAPSRGTGGDWLARLVQKPHAALHPLQHLLLARAIGVSLDELLAGRRAPPPRTSADVTTAAPSAWPTAEWENTLRALAADPSVRLAAIARALGVDPITVRRHAMRLGVARDEWRDRPGDGPGTRRAEQRRAYRERARAVYEGLRRAHPAKGRTELERLAPREVPWLRRHDGAWLTAQQPPRRGAPRAGPGVDWAARDRVLREQVGAAAARLRALPRPKRVTVNAVLLTMRRPSVAADLARLPRTRAALRAAAESAAAFAARRLAWAAGQYRAEGAAPSAADLLTRAALGMADRTRLRGRAVALAAALAAACTVECTVDVAPALPAAA